MVPLTIKQIHSMQRLQVLAPELKALQQKYKTDKKRQQEEVMRFYRENKVNPAASCLPLLLQIPIFISLFYVLQGLREGGLPALPRLRPRASSGSSRTSPTRSARSWSGWLLLVVYVASQLASTLLTPVTDKTQRIIFIVLPFAFIFFIINFPIGLLLYWVTTNLWTVGQGLVTRRLMPKPRRRRSAARARRPQTAPAAGAAPPGTAAAAPKPKPAASGERRVRRRKKRGPQTRR